MRALAFLLHPPELDELGLSKSLDRFCAGFAHRTGLAIDFILGRLPGGLSSAAEHALFRVCQEALMNVHVHAFARCVTVRIGMRRQNLLLEVQDDGIGVEAPARLEQDGVGLASMRARMAEVGGELTFDLTGPGLTVVARIPMR
jgi:signal transduction histidine kinase